MSYSLVKWTCDSKVVFDTPPWSKVSVLLKVNSTHLWIRNQSKVVTRQRGDITKSHLYLSQSRPTITRFSSYGESMRVCAGKVSYQSSNCNNTNKVFLLHCSAKLTVLKTVLRPSKFKSMRMLWLCYWNLHSKAQNIWKALIETKVYT